MDEFIKKVARLRSLQKGYFKNRDIDVLKQCKALEIEVDKDIEEAFKRADEQRQVQEPTLF